MRRDLPLERSFAANIFNVKPQFIWLKTPVCNLLKIRMIPSVFQNAEFQPLKGHLLEILRNDDARHTVIG